MSDPIPNTLTIQLTKGYSTVIDTVDADLAQRSWYASIKTNAAYAYTQIRVNGKKKCIGMHRLILERMIGRPLERFEFTDHINNNPLDNRRCNLRLATPAQNMCNQGKSTKNKSGFKGVCYEEHGRKRWVAYISISGKRKKIGRFDTPEAAHEAYKKAAAELHGEFARFE